MSKRKAPNSPGSSTLADPMNDESDFKATSSGSSSDSSGNLFRVRFERGALLHDAVTYLSALNKSCKFEVWFTLMAEENKTYFTMTIKGVDHFTKCRVICSLLDQNDNVINPGKMTQTLSRFPISFSQVERTFASVDRTKPVLFTRQGNNFSLEYRTKHEVFMSVGLTYTEPTDEEQLSELINSLQYEHQLLVPRSNMADFFDQAMKIDNTVVNALIYHFDDLKVLELQLDAKPDEAKHTCFCRIGYEDIVSVDMTDQVETPPTKPKTERPSLDSICTLNNLYLVNTYRKDIFGALAKIGNVDRFKVFMEPVQVNSNIPPTPARFTVDTGDVFASFYLNQYINPDALIQEKISAARQKK